ncbi:MAG TPA: hypothetical protein VKY85_07600 [Candidatus Angelobacter sp.]|nr:hypothetical protein [Candidatus Angelobacter sp.]
MAPGSKFPPGLLRTPFFDGAGNINLAWQKWLQTQGTTGGSTGTANFADAEIPQGTINGVNAVFTLANSPNPASSLQLYKNGQKLTQGIGFTLAGNRITYAAAYIPQPGDTHEAIYRH